jgi:protein TIF31
VKLQLPESKAQVELAERIPKPTNELAREVSIEPEEGWQPVQRPRSAAGPGKRVKHHRPNSHQTTGDGTADTAQYKARYSYSNNRYYLVKKRTMVPSGYTENQHVKVQSTGARFSRKIYRAVTYRIKTTMPAAEGSTDPNWLESNQDQRDGELAHGGSLVSPGSGMSYKDVAVAPPGTIAKAQIQKPKDDSMLKAEKEASDVKETSERSVTEDVKQDDSCVDKEMIQSQNKEMVKVKTEVETEKTANESSSSDLPAMDIEVVSSGEREQTTHVLSIEPTHGHNNQTDTVEPSEPVVETDSSAEGSQPDLLHDSLPSSIEPMTGSNFTTRQENLEDPESTDLKPKLFLNTAEVSRGEMPNKKLLSASAPPFNPSSPPAVLSPVALPGTIPGVATPWPLSMAMHPGPPALIPTPPPMSTSPHHQYGTAQRPPNMLRPLPFLYAQPPQGVVPTSFAMGTAGMYRPQGHYTWQPYMNLNASEFMPRSVWPACHPIDFPIPPPASNPVSESMLDAHAHVQSDPAVVTLVSSLEDSGLIPEALRKDEQINLHEVMQTATTAVESHPSNLENQVSNTIKVDLNPDMPVREGSVRVYLKGRSRRKQTLRIPISLLNRPYGSRSFKFVYNRVVRDNDISRPAEVTLAEA